ncbi:MAG: hypothetical protein ACRC62_27545 [Microcoleus sp.]
MTALKTDVADIKSSIKPIIGRTVYTTATVLNAEIGDEIHIDGEGTIQLPTAPDDGADIFIFDELGKIKENKNNILLGAGDRWRMRDDTFETAPLIFNDDHLRRGWMLLKYSVSSKSWWPYVHYGTSGASSGTGLSEVQHDAAEQNPLPISSKPSVQFHLEGGGGAKVESSLPDGWWATVLNTTNDPQPISFDADLMVFLRDGSQIDPVDSPYQLKGNSVVTLQMVDNGFKFLQIIPHGGGGTAAGGDRIESIPLDTLPAGAWTPFPMATGTIKDFKIFDSTGNDISSLVETRRTAASGWEVFSLVRQEDLIFEYEITPKGDSKIEKFVLPLLPANVWTNLPVATGVIADYKIFDSDVDISDLLDIRRINGIYEARSLVDLLNLQIEYEIGA